MKSLHKFELIKQIKFFFVQSILSLAILAIIVMFSSSWAATYYVDTTNGMGSTTQNILSRSPVDTIPSNFFGMHVGWSSTSTPWPAVPFGTWRLWDSQVIWPLLEPNKGEWHFETLDRTINLAEAHNVEILMTLGQSPTWASARPTESSPYGPGAAAEPANIEDWKNYIRTVATRYKGRIHYYEIWNEPDIKTFFSGSVDQMVVLAREAFAILKEVDPTLKVVSPSNTDNFGLTWLEQYFIKGGGNYADIIGFHFYVSPALPEGLITGGIITQVKSLMKKYSIENKPLWNTESGWTKPKIFSSDNEAAGYVARSYIFNWAMGVDRYFWYAWDDHDWVTLEMTEADNRTLRPSAIAFAEIQKWLVGAKMISVGQTAQTAWVVKLSRSDGTNAWIVWNPTQTDSFTLPSEMRVAALKDLTGATSNITGATQVTIGITPVLLESSFLLPHLPPQNLRIK